MKTQIRYGVFETNSSSTHALCMCSRDEYVKFCNGELYIKDYHFELKTKEQCIEELKNQKHWQTGEPLYKDVNWEDDKIVSELMSELGYMTMDEYEKYTDDYFETFEQEYTTPKGEKVIAFGYYGHD